MLPLWTDAADGVCVGRLEEAEEVEALIRLFEGTADAEEWQPEGALRSWVSQSTYFALYLQGKLVGGLQLVLPDTEGTLPYKIVWPEVTLPAASRPAHVALLALDAAVRGKQKLFWPLTAEMWRYCVGQRITTLSLEVTPRVYPLYLRLGWPLVRQGEERLHWGEPCSLYTLGIPDVAEALLRRAENSRYYQQIVSQMFRVTISSNKRAIREQEDLQPVAF